jgi:hypothetical protein
VTTETGGVSSMIQLYDSEIIKIEEVLGKITLPHGQRISYEKYTEKIKDLFSRIGLIVSVPWYEAGVERADGTMEKLDGVLIPEIVVQARTDARQFSFDHEQMAHEVQSDLLGLGTGGKLKVTAEDARKALQSVRDHKHGKGCGH